MARSKVPKNLKVDGTEKLAARSQPSDKHEKGELTIEEATVASPRHTRHRAGDFFDFEGEGSAEEEPSGKADAVKVIKSKKKTKKDTSVSEPQVDGGEPVSKPKRGRSAKDDTAEAATDKISKVAPGQISEGSKQVKDGSSKPKKAEKSTKSKKVDIVSSKSQEKNLDAAVDIVGAEAKTKLKKAKSVNKKDATITATITATIEPGSATTEPGTVPIEPGLAMDEGPLNNLLEHEDGKDIGDDAGISIESSKNKKDKKKPAKGAKTSNTEPPETTKGTAVTGTVDAVKGKAQNASDVAGKKADQATKKGKAGLEKAKKTAKEQVPSADKPAEVADAVRKEVKAGTEKAKKATKSAKDKLPKSETPAAVADVVSKEAKTAAKKTKKTGDTIMVDAPSTELPAKASKAVSKKAQETAEKTKKVVEPQVEPSKSKKRKASTSEADAVKANILDPLSEHAEASATKKQKKEKKKSKSIGATVGDALTSAAEGVNAAGASIGAFASSFMGAATEAVEGTEDVARKTADSATSAAKSAIGAATETVEGIEDAAKKSAASTTSAAKSIVGSAADAAAGTKDAAKKSATSAAQGIMGVATEAVEGTEDAVRKSADSAISAAKSTVGAATDAATGTKNAAKKSVDSATSAAKSTAKKAKGKAKAIVEDVAESSGMAALSEAPEGEDEYESDAEPDDQTAALLAGFESDRDDEPAGPGFADGEKLPEIPNAEKTMKKLKGVKVDGNEEPGVVYVGRIPHGFYEHQMRAYFSQFGDINRLRLSRNKHTGASRHWAFVEFKSAGVAHIVAETMDNYLMFGHILKCKTVPKEQLHENVWKGANKRFKKVPWNQMEGRKHEVAVGREQWTARNEREEKRRADKNKKTKEIGYDFEAPPLKSVSNVPKKDLTKKVEDVEIAETYEEEKSLVTAHPEGVEPVVISEEVKTKKSKKTPKVESTTTTTVTKTSKRTLDTAEETAGSVTKKAKKVAKGAAK